MSGADIAYVATKAFLRAALRQSNRGSLYIIPVAMSGSDSGHGVLALVRAGVRRRELSVDQQP
eukprot:2749637-Rhodomonas_salina.2